MEIQYSLPTTWTEGFLRGVARLNTAYEGRARIAEVYGSLPKSVSGSGRSPQEVPAVTRAEFAEHVAVAHRYGLRLKYLITGICVGGRECSVEWRSELRDFVTWLVACGVDSVAVAMPHLIPDVKDQFPDLHVRTSILCFVRSAARARRLASLGADSITVDFDVPRLFPLIREIREAVTCDIAMYANTSCLFECPYKVQHFNAMSHASQPGGDMNDRAYYSFCTSHMLEEPVEFIRSPWIRPEDVRTYVEGFGISTMKLGGRGKSETWLLALAEAYMQERYQGNLFDLIGKEYHKFKRAEHGRGATLPTVHIDNRRIGELGFLKFMMSKEHHDCSKCDFCETVAEAAVHVDADVFRVERHQEGDAGRQ